MVNADLKLEWLVQIPLFGPPSLKTPQLRDIATTYTTNVTQLKSLFIFPLLAIHFAGTREKINAAALMAVAGKLDSNITKEQKAQVVVHQKQMWTKILKGDAGGGSRVKPPPVKPLQAQGAVAAPINELHQQAHTDQRIVDGIQAWLSAQIVGAWTAFETLASDLWEAALNCHPAVLAELRGTRKGAPAGESKTVRLDQLQRFRYDLSTSMGTILKEKRSFDRLSSIRENYSDAFAKDADEITDILNHKSADALSAVRNLIAHRASRVDQRYLDRTKNLTSVPKANIGERIILNGELTAKLVAPVLGNGQKLLIAVDQWLSTH
jgi:hypothetical protein